MCRTRDPTPHWHRFDWWRALLFFTRNLFETEGNQFVLLNRVHHFHQSDELNHVLKQNHVLYCNWTILHAFSTSRNRLAFRLFRKSLSDSDLIFFRKNPLKHLQHLFCLGQRKSQNESRIHFRIHQQQQQQVCVCVCMAYLRAVEMFHFFYCRHFRFPSILCGAFFAVHDPCCTFHTNLIDKNTIVGAEIGRSGRWMTNGVSCTESNSCNNIRK